MPRGSPGVATLSNTIAYVLKLTEFWNRPFPHGLTQLTLKRYDQWRAELGQRGRWPQASSLGGHPVKWKNIIVQKITQLFVQS